LLFSPTSCWIFSKKSFFTDTDYRTQDSTIYTVVLADQTSSHSTSLCTNKKKICQGNNNQILGFIAVMAQFCNPTLLEPKEDFQDKFLDKNLV
jgi:hypothetical protein